MTPLARRLRALVLALVFLTGGTSLPSIDVLVFHLHGQESRATPHFEPANGCSTHAGHCAVGCPASTAGALGAQFASALLTPATPETGPRSPTCSPVLYARGVGFQSRAPPVPHA